MSTEREFLVRMGQQIRQVRLEKGLSQTALANACQLGKANMSRIEAGRINLTILTLRKICRALDINPGDMVKSFDRQDKV